MSDMSCLMSCLESCLVSCAICVYIFRYLLIAIWGGDNRRYASIKFFIYTFTASVIMLVGFMALYFEAGVNSFSMIDIANNSSGFSREFQIWVFAALFIGFAVKVPSVPWHTVLAARGSAFRAEYVGRPVLARIHQPLCHTRGRKNEPGGAQ